MVIFFLRYDKVMLIYHVGSSGSDSYQFDYIGDYLVKLAICESLLLIDTVQCTGITNTVAPSFLQYNKKNM